MNQPEVQNAFETPQSDDSDLIEATLIYTRPGPEDLPSRWLRLAATIVDLLILIALAIPLTFAYAIIGPIEFDVAPEKAFLVPMVITPIVLTLLYGIVNGYPLAKKGQTWGKKICGIKIVLTNGRPADLFRLVCVRFFPFMVMGQIPFVAWIVVADILYISTQQKRCLHDLMAYTIVVKA